MRMLALTRGLAALLIGCVSLARAAQPDGPYVVAEAGQWQALSVVVDQDTARRQSEPVRPGQRLTIAAVGAVPAWQVTLRPPAPLAADAATLPEKSSLFVVADTHGEYEILVGMLRAHRIIGPQLQWRFGRGHLLVLGDVFDRGPNHLEILWLLYELEAQARAAGGGVHLVLGNHEFMVLSGDERYLHPKYLETRQVLGVENYARLFAGDAVLGQWLRTRPTILRLNELLCLHGGISRALVDSTLSLAEVNATVREALEDPGQASRPRGAVAELVLGGLGPLWYRGYFPQQVGVPLAPLADIDAALATYGGRRLLVGHTIVPTITALYGGKVIAVQVYPKRDGAQVQFEALLIRHGRLFRALPEGAVQPLGDD